MPRNEDPALEEAGLTTELVAASCARVFAMAVGNEPAEDLTGWIGAVNAASDVIGGGGESDVEINLSRFADTLRSAFGRAVNPDLPPVPAEELTDAVRMGWQAVTRHVNNVFAMDSKEARKIENHEAAIVEFVKTRSATPK